MNVYPSDIVGLASSFQGYLEKETNSQLYDSLNNYGPGNYTKFGYEMDHQYYKWYKCNRNGQPWGGLFVEYCWVAIAGLDEAKERLYKPELPCTGYDIESAYKCFEVAGELYAEPLIGDQVFFVEDNGRFSHTGIVTSVTEEYVVIIEGDRANTVSFAQYLLTDKTIKAYGRPRYDELPEDEDILSFHVSLTDSPYTWWSRYNMLSIINRVVLWRYAKAAGRYMEVGEILDFRGCKPRSEPFSTEMKIIIRDDYDEIEIGTCSPAGSGNYQIPNNRPLDVIITNKRYLLGLRGPLYPYNYYKNWEINVKQFEGCMNLRDLYFCNSSLYGNIEAFESCRHITNLDLSRSEVSGSIKNYKDLAELTYLNLSGTKIKFELPKGEAPDNLSKLYLANDDIDINIRGFQDLNKLTELDLSGSKMDGTAFPYRFVTMLRRVYLRQPGLVSNINIFSNHKQMQRMALDGLNGAGDYWPPEVWRKMDKKKLSELFSMDALGSLVGMTMEGEIGKVGVATKIKSICLKDLDTHGTLGDYVEQRTGDTFRYNTKYNLHWRVMQQRIHKLEGLTLIRSDIEGDIPKKLQLYNIRHLHICRTKMSFPTSQLRRHLYINELTLQDFDVYGDIAEFEDMVNMEQFDLKGTNITGDIAVLNNFTKLQRISICRPLVGGKIESWTDLQALTRLSLRQVSTISGDMKDFVNLKELETLQLIKCPNITGDVASLQELPELKNLYIMDCPKIYGNLSCFAKFPKLERICIFTPKIKGHSSQLRKLGLLRFFAYGDKLNQGWWTAV